MGYTKTNWQDGVTPLSAQKMNNLESQYDAVKTELGNNAGELWDQIRLADGIGSGLDADLWQGVDLSNPTGHGTATDDSVTVNHNLGRIPIVIFKCSDPDGRISGMSTTSFTLYSGYSGTTWEYWYW